MSDYLMAREIRSILEKLRNAKSVKEISTSPFVKASWKMEMTTKEQKTNAIQQVFLKQEPGAALKKLVELRLGSASDQSRIATSVVDIDIEDTQLEFSWIYRYFFSSVRNASCRETGALRELLRGNAIEFVLRDLKSTTFRKYKRESTSKSQTAAVIRIQLNIINNIVLQVSLTNELRKELEKNGFFDALKFYSTDRSVPPSTPSRFPFCILDLCMSLLERMKIQQIFILYIDHFCYYFRYF